MKYILVFLFSLSCYANNKDSERPGKETPKFVKGQTVVYDVPRFYKKVCSGIGIIDAYLVYLNENTYLVLTPDNEKACGVNFWLEEKKIIKVVK